MKVTKVFLLVMHALDTLQRREEPITATRIARELDLEWNFEVYLKRISFDQLIVPVVINGVKSYELTDEGKRFCVNDLKSFDAGGVRESCRLYQNRWGIARLQDILEILITIRDLRESNKQAWPTELARKLGKHPKGFSKALQVLEQDDLLTSRLETEQERYKAMVAERRRVLYELGDVGKELLALFA